MDKNAGMTYTGRWDYQGRDTVYGAGSAITDFDVSMIQMSKAVLSIQAELMDGVDYIASRCPHPIYTAASWTSSSLKSAVTGEHSSTVGNGFSKVTMDYVESRVPFLKGPAMDWIKSYAGGELSNGIAQNVDMSRQ